MNQIVQAPPSLEELRAAHRATARYSIYRHRLGGDGYSRVKEPLEYPNLTWDQVTAECERLNTESWEAAGKPSDCWALTRYNPKLETPLPSRWTASTIVTNTSTPQ